MIYILLLQENKIYVGYSARPIGDRFIEHFNYTGSKWTSKYRPLQVLEVRKGGQEVENEITLQMMEKYGWWNVRGGSWCQVEMNKCPPALLERQKITLPSKLSQHNVDSKIVKKSDTKPNRCSRCGRNSHLVAKCYAKTHLNGNVLTLDRHSYKSNSKAKQIITISDTESDTESADSECAREIPCRELIQNSRSANSYKKVCRQFSSNPNYDEYSERYYQDSEIVMDENGYESSSGISSTSFNSYQNSPQAYFEADYDSDSY
ncbi:Cullin-4A [Boothiomyces sp. JEL0866]|nr:Cullin-4A [Boothiomyces sp. JEL0866]